MNATVLGDGAWGTTLALLLHANGHSVTLWGPFPDYVADMMNKRENPRFLPGVPLPESLTLEPDISRAAAAADLVVLASPSQYMRGVCEQLKDGGYPADGIYVNVAKGIEVETLAPPGRIVRETLGDLRYAALCGPSHAEEVSQHVPTAIVAASADAATAEAVQDAFMNASFRVYTSLDPVGVELGAALKNVFALAAGICDGIGFGDNSKAALITRGIVEMARLGKALGGKRETFAGLSGVGDLIVTCSSKHSRNRRFGEELGKGLDLAEVKRAMGMVVAEGVKTCRSAYRLARQVDVSTPIIDQVYATLYEKKAPRQAAHDLMTREGKRESLELET